MIKRISHIGIIVRDLDSATRFWRDTYGLEPYSEYEAEVEGIRARLLSVGGQPATMSVELIEPLDPGDMNNAIARRLATSGEGFYHLAVEVDDVAASEEALRARGLTVMHRPPVAGLTGERWLVHPKSSNGVMVEGV
jgi:methylmalonyl-CoA epimerase